MRDVIEDPIEGTQSSGHLFVSLRGSCLTNGTNQPLIFWQFFSDVTTSYIRGDYNRACPVGILEGSCQHFFLGHQLKVEEDKTFP